MTTTTAHRTNGQEPPAGGDATGAVGIVAQMCRTTNALRSHIERTVLCNEGIRWSTFDALTVVCARQKVEARTVASEIGIAKATLTDVLSVLIGRGLIRRWTHPDDGRRVVLQPTEAGNEFVVRVHARVRAEEARLLREMKRDAARDLIADLAALADRSRRMVAAARAEHRASPR